MRNNNFEKENVQEKIQKLKYMYLAYVEKMKNEGIPLTEDGRVDMDLFRELLGEKTITRDKNKINNIAKAFDNSDSNLGEIAELLVAIVFNEFMNDKFLIFRSSVYDDILNGADTIIVDKKTGKIVCAVDEASSVNSNFFIEKKKKIANKNNAGGVKIKYGLTYNKGSIQLASLENVPIFVLGFPLSEVIGLIDKINISAPTETEKALFNFFVALINDQCRENKINFKLDQIK